MVDVIEISESQSEDDEIQIVGVRAAPSKRQKTEDEETLFVEERRGRRTKTWSRFSGDDDVVFVSETPAPKRERKVEDEVEILAPTDLSERSKASLLTKLLAEKQTLTQQVQSLQQQQQQQKTEVDPLRRPGYWRRDGEGRRIPRESLASQNGKHAAIDLPCTTDEYDSIVSRFVETGCADTEVLAIQRVVNDDLWEAYSLRRAKMTARKTKAKGGTFSQDALPGLGAEKMGLPPDPACERYLFHGASPQTIDAILDSGIDFRLSQTTGAMGACAYFADQASYSRNYCCMPDHAANARGATYHHGVGGSGYAAPGATLKMLVCRVLLGDCAPGTGGLRRPPPKPTGSDLFDSVSNNPSEAPNYMSRGVMFGVFDNAQVYPEYVIHYRKKAGQAPPAFAVAPQAAHATAAAYAYAMRGGAPPLGVRAPGGGNMRSSANRGHKNPRSKRGRR